MEGACASNGRRLHFVERAFIFRQIRDPPPFEGPFHTEKRRTVPGCDVPGDSRSESWTRPAASPSTFTGRGEFFGGDFHISSYTAKNHHAFLWWPSCTEAEAGLLEKK